MTIDQQNSNFKLDYDTNNNNSKSKFLFEERRRLVAKLWAQSKTETNIARDQIVMYLLFVKISNF